MFKVPSSIFILCAFVLISCGIAEEHHNISTLQDHRSSPAEAPVLMGDGSEISISSSFRQAADKAHVRFVTFDQMKNIISKYPKTRVINFEGYVDPIHAAYSKPQLIFQFASKHIELPFFSKVLLLHSTPFATADIGMFHPMTFTDLAIKNADEINHQRLALHNSSVRQISFISEDEILAVNKRQEITPVEWGKNQYVVVVPRSGKSDKLQALLHCLRSKNVASVQTLAFGGGKEVFSRLQQFGLMLNSLKRADQAVYFDLYRRVEFTGDRYDAVSLLVSEPNRFDKIVGPASVDILDFDDSGKFVSDQDLRYEGKTLETFLTAFVPPKFDKDSFRELTSIRAAMARNHVIVARYTDLLGLFDRAEKLAVQVAGRLKIHYPYDVDDSREFLVNHYKDLHLFLEHAWQLSERLVSHKALESDLRDAEAAYIFFTSHYKHLKKQFAENLKVIAQDQPAHSHDGLLQTWENEVRRLYKIVDNHVAAVENYLGFASTLIENGSSSFFEYKPDLQSAEIRAEALLASVVRMFTETSTKIMFFPTHILPGTALRAKKKLFAFLGKELTAAENPNYRLYELIDSWADKNLVKEHPLEWFYGKTKKDGLEVTLEGLNSHLQESYRIKMQDYEIFRKIGVPRVEGFIR